MIKLEPLKIITREEFDSYGFEFDGLTFSGNGDDEDIRAVYNIKDPNTIYVFYAYNGGIWFDEFGKMSKDELMIALREINNIGEENKESYKNKTGIGTQPIGEEEKWDDGSY